MDQYLVPYLVVATLAQFRTWFTGTDGTPNESVADVLVRMRQLLSVTETQYSGANIVVVSPDSDNLSVLQASLLWPNIPPVDAYAIWCPSHDCCFGGGGVGGGHLIVGVLGSRFWHTFKYSDYLASLVASWGWYKTSLRRIRIVRDISAYSDYHKKD